MEKRLVYMTAGSLAEARAIGRLLVSNRLAACVNILDHMRSLYRWEGEVKEDEEVVIIAKTRASLIPRVIERVTSIHAYECPCVLSLAVSEGNKPFLDWIEAETA